ncbi:ABC transporter permease [Micromonospora sp. WMMD1102]|uniref:FtsX-like permease family protein n=1 Tax=Micromonospora sp. WMMD1102 TaxID=3016105 RepID=UPI00241566BA|nr:FtsX-like permease family protein [Micromonospora sp. WMMD1102]MDG4788270.1 ABC transporter permease [Micromonospora sp. WMMD1102]
MTGESTGSWRIALRIARRSARRHPGRGLLILLMLFLPAYAATVLVVSWAKLGAVDRDVTFWMGNADLILSASPADLDKLAATLPPGSRTAPHGTGRTVVETAGDGLASYEYEATDPTDPLNHGRYVVRDGTVPRHAAEVALTRVLADQIDARVGDRVRAGMPLRELTVVGIVDISRSLRIPALVAPADAELSPQGGRELLVDLPAGAGWSGPRPGTSVGIGPDGTATPTGIQYGLRERSAAGPTAAYLATQAAAAALVVSFAAAQVVLLVGAAFLVGARRQRRELALVAAAGASPRQVGRIVLAGGLLFGAVAAGLAAPAGIGTVVLAGPAVERISDHPLLELKVPGWSVAGVAVLTVLVGLAAAYLPARSAARGPLRAALGGQRDRSRADLGWLAAGLALLVVGAAVLVGSAHPDGRVELLALGGIMLLLGVTIGAPALVRIVGRLAPGLPVSARLALRHSARHRLRTGAAVAAVSAAVAGSVALGLVGAARDDAAQVWRVARDGQVLLPAEAATVLGPAGIRRLADTLPSRSVVALRIGTDPKLGPGAVVAPESWDPATHVGPAGDQLAIAVGGAETIRAVTGREPTAAELAALRDGAAVLFNDILATDGRAVVGIGASGPVTVPAVVAVSGEYFRDLPGMVVAEATAQRLGLTVTPGRLLVDTERMPRPEEVAAATTVLLREQLAASSQSPPMRVEPARPQRGPTETRIMFWVLAAVSAVVTVAATGVAVGLTATELRNDLATMTAVGAGPRVRRRITAAQAAVVAGLGAPLGVLAGLGPAAGYVAFNTSAHWRTPWLYLLLLGLLPPVVATVLAGVFTGSRPLPVRRTD